MNLIHSNEKNIKSEDSYSFYLSSTGLSNNNKKTKKYCCIQKIEIFDSNGTLLTSIEDNKKFVTSSEVISLLLDAVDKIVAHKKFTFPSLLQRPVYIVTDSILKIDILHYIITNNLTGEKWHKKWKCEEYFYDEKFIKNTKIILWAFTDVIKWNTTFHIFKSAVKYNMKNYNFNTIPINQIKCKMENIFPKKNIKLGRLKKHAYLINEKKQNIIIQPIIRIYYNPNDNFGQKLTNEFNKCIES